MSFNKPLNIRVRKIDPYKRMLHTHPFYIWQVLMRCRTMDKLIGDEGKWRTREEIARLLFSNFDDLPKVDQDIVILCKLKMPISFLKANYFLEQNYEMVRNPTYYSAPSDYRSNFEPREIRQDINEWRAHPHAFGDMTAMSQEWRYQASADSIDKDWGYWIGRPDYEGRARRWLKKEGILI